VGKGSHLNKERAVEDQKNEAAEASFFNHSLEDFKERLIRDIAEVEETTRPKIRNYWVKDSTPFFALIEVPHCDPSADPQSSCRGQIITKVDLRVKNGTKEVNCPQCRQVVSINLAILKLELKLI